MIRQLLSDEPLKEFVSQIANFATETIAHCNEALNAVAAIQVFPNNELMPSKRSTLDKVCGSRKRSPSEIPAQEFAN
jgi:hypothetical protein